MAFGRHLHHLTTGSQGQTKPGKLKKLSSVEAGVDLTGAHDFTSFESTRLAVKSESPGSKNATPP